MLWYNTELYVLYKDFDLLKYVCVIHYSELGIYEGYLTANSQLNCEIRRLTRKPMIRWEFKVHKYTVKLLHTKSWCAVKRNRGDWREKQGGHNQEIDQEA